MRLSRRPPLLPRTLGATVAAVMALAIGPVALAVAAFVATTDADSGTASAAAAFPGFQATALADSPTFAWRMDNAPGTTTASDASPNVRPGTYNPSTTSPVSKNLSGAPGTNGNKAIRLPGPSSAVSTWGTIATAISTRSHRIASADFNSDGFTDSATTLFTSGTVEVRFGKAGGGWASTVTLTGGNANHDIAAGDLNGDGVPDLLWGNSSGAGIYTAMSNDNGTFGAVATISAGASNAIGVAIGQVDADGKGDLAAAFNGTAQVSVHRFSTGYGTPTNYTTFAAVRVVRLVDLNGDGYDDLVYISLNASLLGVRLNNGAGGFGAETTYATGASTQAMEVGDVDSDGDIDVVTTLLAASPGLAVQLNNGAGAFGTPINTNTPAGTSQLDLADFDGDQRLDAVVTSSANVWAYPGNGAGGFGTRTSLVSSDISTSGVGTGDYDGDGDPDLTAASNAGNTVDQWINSTARRASPNTGGVAGVTPITTAPADFSAEIWFKTTSTTGGRIFGFSRHATGNSLQYDRQLYMTDKGALVWGVSTTVENTLITPGRYNDGKWHHVIGTLGPNAGLRLHVDGGLISNPAITTAVNYPGHWRLGGDTIPTNWPSFPTSPGLAGNFDEFAVYPYQFPAAVATEHSKARQGTAYATEVTTDTPSQYWRLADTATTGVVADTSSNGVTGRFTAPLTLNWAGALGGAGASTGAAQFDGTAGTTVGANGVAVAAPSAYTQELWVRTVTATGGGLLSIGATAAGVSGFADRQVYMLNTGQLRAGIYDGTTTHYVTSPLTYNDGAWHHVAVTFDVVSGLRLYVDGELVNANATQIIAFNSNGYWRVGGDNLLNWSGRPTRDYFAGAIDEVSVYPRVLGAAQVRGHFRARDRTG